MIVVLSIQPNQSSVSMTILKRIVQFFCIFELFSSCQFQSQTFIRVRAIKCSSSSKTTKDITCTIKSSKKDVLVTATTFLMRKIPEVKMNYRLDRLTIDNMNTMVDLKDMPICNILVGLKTSPIPFIQYIFNYAK